MPGPKDDRSSGLPGSRLRKHRWPKPPHPCASSDSQHTWWIEETRGRIEAYRLALLQSYLPWLQAEFAPLRDLHQLGLDRESPARSAILRPAVRETNAILTACEHRAHRLPPLSNLPSACANDSQPPYESALLATICAYCARRGANGAGNGLRFLVDPSAMFSPSASKWGENSGMNAVTTWSHPKHESPHSWRSLAAIFLRKAGVSWAAIILASMAAFFFFPGPEPCSNT